jgi:nicotinamidase-related amidase
MQYDFLSNKSPLFVKGGHQIIDNLAMILEFFRKHNFPQIFARRFHRADSSDVDKQRIELF